MRNRDFQLAAWIGVASLGIAVDACAFRRGSDMIASLPDSAYGNERLARELRPAAEFPLYHLDFDSSTVAFRMVTLGAWGGARVMRLEQHGAAWRFVVKATDNGTPRRLMLSEAADVASAQADSLVAILAASHYWTRPAQTCRLGLDGYRIVLEARIRTEYFTINCWVPEERGAPAVVRSMRAFQALSASAFPAPGARAP